MYYHCWIWIHPLFCTNSYEWNCLTRLNGECYNIRQTYSFGSKTYSFGSSSKLCQFDITSHVNIPLEYDSLCWYHERQGRWKGARSARSARSMTCEHKFAAGEYQFWDKHPHHQARPHERESWIYDVVFCSVCYPQELRRLIREEEKARKELQQGSAQVAAQVGTTTASS